MQRKDETSEYQRQLSDKVEAGGCMETLEATQTFRQKDVESKDPKRRPILKTISVAATSILSLIGVSSGKVEAHTVLSDSFNQKVERDYSSLDNIKQFTGDLDHKIVPELKQNEFLPGDFNLEVEELHLDNDAEIPPEDGVATVIPHLVDSEGNFEPAILTSHLSDEYRIDLFFLPAEARAYALVDHLGSEEVSKVTTDGVKTYSQDPNSISTQSDCVRRYSFCSGSTCESCYINCHIYYYYCCVANSDGGEYCYAESYFCTNCFPE